MNRAPEILSGVFLAKVGRVVWRKADELAGRLVPLSPALAAMASKPFELHLELTNLCNANCVFCPYQFQTRPTDVMSDVVFERAVQQFVDGGGGSVGLTPIVGDALIDPSFVARVRHLRAQERVDRIWVTTNAILLEKHGIGAILDSGLTSITISTSGFDEESYRRIYRSASYPKVHRSVLALLTENATREHPLEITIGLRSDRPLDDVLADPDFQPILALEPSIDFTWSFTSAGGRVARPQLPPGFRLRHVTHRRDPCVQLYNGPIVLPDGTLMACSCVAAMDASQDLGLGNVLSEDLNALWRGQRMTTIRSGFRDGALNPTCAACDMYRDLGLYRTAEGRRRARLNEERARGDFRRREDSPRGAFAGG